jgi:ferredoxin--NADP+ reductase
MYKILRKQALNPTVTLMEILAPAIAGKAEPGQFVILMARESGERIPLTIADFDRVKGTVTVIYQIVGATTELLNTLGEGDSLTAFVGPLGVATHTAGIKKAAVVGGGVGCAIAYPVAKRLHETGGEVHSVIGFRSRGLVILENEFAAASARLVKMSDDGSWGEKGLVTDALKRLIDSGEKYDRVFAIGPLVMMKFVAKLTKEYGLPTTVSMNPIMIDGTGMCGCCRLTVGGQTRFACVDGPDFDGHLVDFDEAMERSRQYHAQERAAHDHMCNLIRKGEPDNA